jgi:hypothetical protein
MTTIVKQVKNEDGTFTYLVNGKVFHKRSKKDYTYFMPIGSFSSSLKSIEATQKFWINNGNESVNKENLKIILIEKN